MRTPCAAPAAAGIALLAGCASHNHGCLADLGQSGSDRPGAVHPGDPSIREATLLVLDNLHRFAAQANFSAYFACYTPDAIFMGTDATERWTLDEFKAYAKPHFDAGKGWTYTAIEGRRFIEVSGDGRTAWFDEALHNAKLGECRGTGVLSLGSDGRWRIAHYNLTMPVPNAIIESVAERIRAGS